MSTLAKIKKVPKISLLALLGVTFVFTGFLSSKPEQITKAETTDCFGTYASMYGNSGTTGIISGIANINVGITTSSQVPSKVTILLDGMEIGQARPESGSSYSWIMQIPTKVLNLKPDGYELRAKINYGNYECVTQPTFTPAVDPGGQTEFSLVANKSNIEIPVNTSLIVSAALNVPGYTNNFAQFALFDWFTESRGTVTPTQNRSTNFFSGPSAGEGKIKAVARYGFRASDTRIYTKITNPDSPINNTTNTTTSTTNTSTTDKTSDSDQSEGADEIQDDVVAIESLERSTSLESNDLTKDCAEAALGPERFKLINEGKARPTPEEILKLKACFARTNYILPSNFAPVAPGDVSKLQLTSSAKAEKPENAVKEYEGKQRQVLRFSGKAKPASTVVLYIFSEPLVLTTAANENGEWEYELENPLEPGDHTMYAVVDRGDGIYERTDPVEFAIGSAEATAENPAGLSLALSNEATATDSKLSTYLYVGSSAMLIAAIVLVAIVAYRHGKRSSSEAAVGLEVGGSETSSPIMPTINPQNTQTIQPNSNQIIQPQIPQSSEEPETISSTDNKVDQVEDEK